MSMQSARAVNHLMYFDHMPRLGVHFSRNYGLYWTSL